MNKCPQKTAPHFPNSVQIFINKKNKVKWNLSHAIGVAMRRFGNWQMQLANPIWLQSFYDTLLELLTESVNFKVRINACIALMTVDLVSRVYYIRLWRSLIHNFACLNALDDPKQSSTSNNGELEHRASLIHQLGKMFTYLCKHLHVEDLTQLNVDCLNQLNKEVAVAGNSSSNINNKSGFSLSQLRAHLIGYIRNIFGQIEVYKLEGWLLLFYFILFIFI